MINLRIQSKFSWEGAPCVLKLEFTDRACKSIRRNKKDFALCEHLPSGHIRGLCEHGEFIFQPPQKDVFDGDVVLCFPKQGRIERLFRANSRYNTLTLTERCDQLCVMCSQPPRNTNDAWRFPIYEKAISLVSEGATICLSGGEPTLYKDELFSMLENLSVIRPDLNFQILSNGQHVTESDIPRLKNLHKQSRILWGIPLYADISTLHEEMVDKDGSFDVLMKNFFVLGSSGATIEIRTVVTALNVLELPSLASFISQHLGFAAYWAIMAMEPIGFARANLKNLFYDHSIAPQPIHKAIDIAIARGLDVKLFNFPLCSIGDRYRRYCEQSISDWKKKYLPDCDECNKIDHCSGFFEWYDVNSTWSNIRPIR